MFSLWQEIWDAHYLMPIAGQVSLQLPATATSTLHTDTINFIRGQVGTSMK